MNALEKKMKLILVSWCSENIIYSIPHKINHINVNEGQLYQSLKPPKDFRKNACTENVQRI